MSDSVDALAAHAGLSRATMLDIADQVKRNHATLAACARHDFEAIEPGRLATRHRCKHCSGEVDGSARRWYELGLQHGGAA